MPLSEPVYRQLDYGRLEDAMQGAVAPEEWVNIVCMKLKKVQGDESPMMRSQGDEPPMGPWHCSQVAWGGTDPPIHRSSDLLIL